MFLSTRYIVVSAIAIVAALALMFASAEALGDNLAQARSVRLSDATVSPDRLVMVPAHGRRAIRRQCGPRIDRALPKVTDYSRAFFTEFSAYRWNGEALPSQRWNADRTLVRWGGVTFDGLTVANHYNRPVLFAGWCS